MNRMYWRSLALIFAVLLAAQIIRAQGHPASGGRSEITCSRFDAHSTRSLAVIWSDSSIDAIHWKRASSRKCHSINTKISMLDDSGRFKPSTPLKRTPDFAFGYALLSFAARRGRP